jgi:hypothetical protein
MAEFEEKRPVDPEVPAAAPWKFNNVSIHSIEHIRPPVGECSSYSYSYIHRNQAQQRPGAGPSSSGAYPKPWQGLQRSLIVSICYL